MNDPLVPHDTRLMGLTFAQKQILGVITQRMEAVARNDEPAEPARLFQDCKMLMHLIGGEFAERTRPL